MNVSRRQLLAAGLLSGATLTGAGLVAFSAASAAREDTRGPRFDALATGDLFRYSTMRKAIERAAGPSALQMRPDIGALGGALPMAPMAVLDAARASGWKPFRESGDPLAIAAATGHLVQRAIDRAVADHYAARNIAPDRMPEARRLQNGEAAVIAAGGRPATMEAARKLLSYARLRLGIGLHTFTPHDDSGAWVDAFFDWEESQAAAFEDLAEAMAAPDPAARRALIVEPAIFSASAQDSFITAAVAVADGVAGYLDGTMNDEHLRRLLPQPS